uniref:Uncharacterized protein n=1 Tax=Glossina pallidipes TaxID=7398 RepID=A0A1A9Z6P9_GLOPL
MKYNTTYRPRHNKGFYGVMVSTLDFESSDPSSNLAEISMETVTVQRYISCKRPDYAKDYPSSEETDLEDFLDSRLLTITSQHDKRHRKHGREEFTK